MKKLIPLILSFLLIFNLLNAQIFVRETSILDGVNDDSRSANWVDLNNDGFLDMFISNGKSTGQNNRVYFNNGQGAFSSLTGSPLKSDNMPSDGATFADVNNSGHLSAFVANWYNKKNLFYYDDGINGLTQITNSAPANLNSYSEAGSWGDYDNDGLVDLYVTNSYSVLQNYIYHNDGNGLFTKMNLGDVSNDQFSSRSVNWIDYDNDGDQDLFVSNENFEANNLYRNDSIGVFTKLINGPLLSNTNSSMSSSWADYDNDGDFDVFISNYGQNNKLFRNDGFDIFTEIANDTVSKGGGSSFSASWGDVDNDGDLDLFVGNAFAGSSRVLNFFYLNNGDGSFSRNSTDTISKIRGWNYGNAFGDYDNDGDLDLLTANCFNNSEANRLFRNVTSDNSSNNWIEIKCEGRISNRSGIGARVKIKSTINGIDVWQMREVSAQSSYCGQNMLMIHFGLGDASIVDSLLIYWPSGIIDTATQVSANSQYQMIEDSILSPIILSTKTRIDKTGFNVYPQPSNEILNVVFNRPVDEVQSVNMIDFSGRIFELYDYRFKGKLMILKMNRNKLTSGMYILTIETTIGFHTKKIVLE
jgi:hypothetical protein